MDLRRSLSTLSAPVDASWLVAFRVGFGVLITWHAISYLSNGWVRKYWIAPPFHFKFPLFEWVAPWAGDGMIYHFWGLAALGVLISLGLLYRVAAVLLFLGLTHVFLLEEARYQNHTYLISLLAFLMIFLPAHRSTSVDALFRPELRSETVPGWTLWLVRFQVGVPYFFGGVAKINGDWLRGEPLREWLPRKADFPFFGPHFAEDWAIYLFSYGGLLLDLFAVPLLLWRRTRVLTFGVLFLFHCSNAELFSIGVFPWLMVVMTTVFFDPDMPRRLCSDLWPRPTWRGALTIAGAASGVAIAVALFGRIEFPVVLAGIVGGAVIAWNATPQQPPRPVVANNVRTVSDTVRTLFAAWVVVQVVLPLRHFVIPGDVAWTGEGGRFAWHMKLNDRDGHMMFEVRDPATGMSRRVDPRAVLARWQVRRMDGRPHMMREFAQYLARREAWRGTPNVEVRVRATVSLNNWPEAPIVDPDVDLVTAPAPLFARTPWITSRPDRVRVASKP